jgi:hypothetical protein
MKNLKPKKNIKQKSKSKVGSPKVKENLRNSVTFMADDMLIKSTPTTNGPNLYGTRKQSLTKINRKEINKSPGYSFAKK